MSKEFHNFPVKIQIMHMVLKNKLIKKIYLTAGFIPPTQTEQLSFCFFIGSGENDVWKMYGGGYVWIYVIFVPSKLSLYTIDYCRYALSGDGWGIFISGHSRNSNNNH